MSSETYTQTFESSPVFGRRRSRRGRRGRRRGRIHMICCKYMWGRHGRDRMVVGFTTTCEMM